VIIGVGVVSRNQEGKILMKMRKGDHGESEWALIGGQVEFGESFENAARRELVEETGLEGSKAEVISLSNQLRYTTEGVHCVIIGVAVTIPKDAEPKNLEPEKCGGFEWFAPDKLPPNIFEGSNQILTALIKGGSRITYVRS